MSGSGFAWASIDELRSRTSMKWRAYPPDVLPLWVAEMDTELAPAVREALLATLGRGDTGYPAGHVYAEALGRFAAERWGWSDYSVSRTSIVPDVMMGIVEVIRLISDAHDAVVVTPPVYPPFYAFATSAERTIVEAPLGTDLRVDLDSLADAFVRAKTYGAHPVFLLSNPHNPTGVVHTRAELEAVAALAREHGVRVVSDEIHAPLVLPGAQFTPFLTVAGGENAFALMSASKGWNLAGLKAALAIAGPESAADLRRMPEEVSHGPSHLGIIAHAAAYDDRSGWLDDLITALDANRTLLAERIKAQLPSARHIPPEGTYLAWLDFRAAGFAADVPLDGPGIVSDLAGPARFLVDEARVALSSGHVFGTGGAGCARLNFATSPAILGEALDRMAAALAGRGVNRP